jgi:hypothetical protein
LNRILEQNIGLIPFSLVYKGDGKMKRQTTVRKNLDLLDEFMKYAFGRPNVLEQIPGNASLVILPEGDPSLEKENRRTLNKLKARGEEVVAIKLRATKRKILKVG